MNCVLKYPGSKWSTAEWIASFFPDHRVYLEPYFGSGAVFFAKKKALHETINDLDSMVINYFRVIRDNPEELARAIYLTPYARCEYNAIQENRSGEEIQITGDPIEDARRFAIRCFQGFGSKQAQKSGWKRNLGPNGARTAKVWTQAVDAIMEAAARMKEAQIECMDAVQLIKDFNQPDCLIYADPPYLGSTRGGSLYRVEMMEEERHVELLEALKAHGGHVVLSGYESDLYNKHLSGWRKAYRESTTNTAAKKTEVLWMNFDEQLSMFR